LRHLSLGGYYAPGSTGSLYVNQKKGIASFNFSTALTNVDYGGKKSDIKCSDLRRTSENPE
jgi:hypothetical protein